MRCLNRPVTRKERGHSVVIVISGNCHSFCEGLTAPPEHVVNGSILKSPVGNPRRDPDTLSGTKTPRNAGREFPSRYRFSLGARINRCLAGDYFDHYSTSISLHLFVCHDSLSSGYLRMVAS